VLNHTSLSYCSVAHRCLSLEINHSTYRGYLHLYLTVVSASLPFKSVCFSGHIQVEEEDEVWGNDVWTRGQILVTLCYSTRRRALVVGILRCISLQPMDSNGFSDPFVKLYVSCTCNYLTFMTYRLMICICRNGNIFV